MEENINETVGIQSESATMIGHNVAGIINNIVSGSEEKEDVISCPKCGTVPNEEDFGTIKCKKCNTVFFVSSPFSSRISSFPNIHADKNQQYKDMIAHISNHIILGDFKGADNFCDNSIALSPATPQAWEYKAYCSYYITKNKQEIISSNGRIILKYLQVAKSHYQSEDELIKIGTFRNVTERIADKIFNMVKNRIYWARDNKTIEEGQKRQEISKLIFSFKICYDIHPNKSIYLETMIDYYCGYDEESWVDVEIDNSNKLGYKLIDNSHLKGKLFDFLAMFEKQVKKVNQHYKMKEMKGGSIGVRPINISQLYNVKQVEQQTIVTDEQRVINETNFRNQILRQEIESKLQQNQQNE